MLKIGNLLYTDMCNEIVSSGELKQILPSISAGFLFQIESFNPFLSLSLSKAQLLRKKVLIMSFGKAARFEVKVEKPRVVSRASLIYRMRKLEKETQEL